MSAKLFIQIGGQGVPWFKEFARYYGEPQMKKFYDTVIDVVESEIVKFEEFKDFYSQFQLRKWLEDQQSLPDEIYLSRALVSMAMIQATQLAHLEYALLNAGVNLKDLLKKTIAITGHSQGLVTATLIAMGLGGENYYKGIQDYTRYFLHLSYQAQLIHPQLYASEEENKESATLDSKTPEPMVAVLSGEHSIVEDFLSKLNQTLPKEERVYISLYNSSTNQILSGLRPSLIKFNKLIQEKINSKEIKYIYLRSSCPFHSPCMEKILQPFDEQLSKINFSYKGRDLKTPVYSFSDGRNMQNDENIGESLCRELMINPLHWDIALKTLIEPNEIEAVIDLGPSKVSYRLSEEILKDHHTEAKFYVFSNPKAQDEFFESFQ